MKSSRNRNLLLAAVVCAIAARAELAQWVQYIESSSAVEKIFFRTVALPTGPVQSRRPPSETAADLTKAIDAAPQEAELLSLRAREYEQQLDFKKAETDWQHYASIANDKLAAQVALADFYNRRLQPKEEMAVLATARATKSDQQTKLFERSIALAEEQQLPKQEIYRDWVTHFADQPPVYRQYFNFLTAQKQYDEGETLIASYQTAFPTDEQWPLEAKASLALDRGSADEAVAIYDRSFRPLWPANIVQQYFELLKKTRGLRTYLDNARKAATARPDDINPPVRLFYYYQQQGNLPQAQRALLEFEMRHQNWTDDERLTLAKLFEESHDYDRAATHYSAAISTEQGLAGVINILFTAPEQPIRIGAGDLSYYKDIATMDPYPGSLNGILSLVFNSSDVQYKIAEQERAAIPYFHRAKASELLVQFDAKFPNSNERSQLHAKLIGAYGAYGQDDAVIRDGRQFLTTFPKAPERTEIALLIADAHARKQQVTLEFATYDALLKELGAAAGGVPIGNAVANPNQPPPANSADYARVLDRYISRLVSLKRIIAAVKLYRSEIDRNINDPGLYERLATFLDQNKLAVDVETTYRRAAEQFSDRSWYHKLARWYLRTKQATKVDQLTQQVVKIFSGSDLDSYVREISGQPNLDPVLYRQINLYASRRFPHDLVFVKNLLHAYTSRGTANQIAWDKLLRQNWYYDEALRSEFFEYLSRTGKLTAELRGLEAIKDRAATQFRGEAQAWRSHFEDAEPLLRDVADQYPAESAMAERAASVERSLGKTEAAAKIEERLAAFNPRDRQILARIGDIYADHEQFDRAAPFWNRVAEVSPGKPDGYIEAATVFWDYYLYDDALRLIQQGRAKLNTPTLNAYEAGAIYEGKRDYTRAIGEYVKGSLAEPGSSAQRRLLNLATRPALRNQVEEATRRLGTDGFALRVAVLSNQNRTAELEQYLLAQVAAATSFDSLARVDDVAEKQGLDKVLEQSLLRQIAIDTDPVDKNRLRISLARFYESHGNTAASQTVDAVYRDNPRLLGVVRAAVDYHWRNKQGARSVDLLAEAAGVSNAAYMRQFTLEAARKATEIADYRRARRLLEPLLGTEPLAADLVEATADTYAREGDDKSLRAFYESKIKASSGDQKASIRRSLIPVLTRLKDYAGGVDQYIEVINRFPEDDGLVREAAAYAKKNNQPTRLSGYYAKASADSPRDYRWPMVLGRVDANLEDFPGAIDAYTKATAIRPDRTDLLTNLAALEERLMRFAEVEKIYARLYELTYHNPNWMVKAAETRARLGQNDAAVQALRVALIEGRPPRARDQFEAARKLAEWGMLDRAKEFANQGLSGARKDDPDALADLGFYAQLMTRMKKYTEGYAAISPYVTGERRSVLWDQMAVAVKQYYTPEEKNAFAAFIKAHMADPALDLTNAAENAGLIDIAAQSLQTKILAKPGPDAYGPLQRLSAMQEKRLKFEDLGHTLEAVWKALPPDAENRNDLLQQAADRYGKVGDTRDELRVLTQLESLGALSGPAAARYNKLLRQTAPDRLIRVAGTGATPDLRNSAANIAMNGDDASLALKAVAARGRGLPPVWTKAYTALAGLFFARTSPEIASAFQSAVGPATVGEEVGHPVDRSQQLAGNIWFYYGSRYGEYLALSKANNAEDYLPAALEGRPANGDAYFTLASYYQEKGALDQALQDYDHTVQLNPRRAGAHNHAAEILWTQGKHDEAKLRWKAALAALSASEDDRRVPESFWTDTEETLTSIGKYEVLADLRADADRVLRTYVRRNGPFRIEPMLDGILAAAGPEEGVRWITDLSRVASDQVSFLGEIVRQEELPALARQRIFERLLDAARSKVARSRGDARSQALSEQRGYEFDWIGSLLESKQTAKAQAALDAMDPDTRRESQSQFVPLQIRAAAQAGKLEVLLKSYDRDRPPLELLRNEATSQQTEGTPSVAQSLLEYIYTIELDAPMPQASTFLGMAEIRLQRNDTAGAMELLRRMTLIAGEPFQYLNPAADLLERFGKKTEASEFHQARAKAFPWELSNPTYEARVQLAQNGAKAPLGSAELDLLASGAPIPPAAAEKLYFYYARVKAAEQTNNNDVRVRLLRSALEINPDAIPPRLPLFRAAVAIGRESLGLAAVSERAETWGEGAERARLLREMAEAYRKLDRPQEAKMFFEQAQRLDPSVPVKKQLDAIAAEEKRSAANALRRPEIAVRLEQDRIVRPRL